MIRPSWQCRACGERGDESVESPPFLPSGLTCLADQPWFAKEYPEGMKHHWSDGTPLSIETVSFDVLLARLTTATRRSGSGRRWDRWSRT